MAAESAATAYRLAKEASVSNLSGSSLTRIHLLSLTALSSYALHARLSSSALSLPAQFGLLVVPLLLACTLFSSPALSLVLNAALAAGCFLAPQTRGAAAQGAPSTPGKARRRSPDNAAVPLLSEPPMRISIDSAADAAQASAAPPTMYVAPDELREGAEASPTGSSADASLSLGGARRPSVPDALNRSVSPLPGASIPRSGSPLSREVRAAGHEQRRHASLASTSSPSLSPVAEPPRGKALRAAAPEAPAAPPADPVPAARPFIAVYRAHMMLMTLICILAVDFERIFARELAKCESWGTSLMDLGVGSFVYSLGLVSARPLLRARTRYEPLRAAARRDVKRAIPLLILGLARVAAVKGSEYPEHVSEYGVHWNFFLTLALLPLAGTLLRPVARRSRWSVVGLVVAALYQCALWLSSLQAWALRAGPRHGLIDANKEGLTSLPGYLAIFLLGLDTGHYVLPLDPYFMYRRERASRAKPKLGKTAEVLASLAICFWIGYGLTVPFGIGTSRRLANLPYVLWIGAFNLSFLLGYVAVHMTLVHGRLPEAKHTPALFAALNEHGLVVFLLGNVLTGVVNLSLRTLRMPALPAMLIMLLYLAACCAAAVELQRRGWRLRL